MPIAVRQVTCRMCGLVFDARHPRAEWCSERCAEAANRYRRKLRDRGRRERLVPTDETGHPATQIRPRIEKRLRKSALPADDWRRAMALKLAERLDNSDDDSAASVTKMAIELDRLMGQVAPSREGEGDFLDKLDDEIAGQREKRRRRA